MKKGVNMVGKHAIILGIVFMIGLTIHDYIKYHDKNKNS